MISRIPSLWALVLTTLLCALCLRAETAVTPTAEPPPVVKRSVIVIPVQEQIADPVLYIVRRGLKEAIEEKADVVVLDMKTPGGSLGTTFEIMEALGKFPGETITYVNNEAMSAGAFISASTKEIWFSPEGVIGAAAPVLSGGQDVEATMKQKIVSYLKARIRATSEGKGYRGQVLSAMIDADFELKIGDKVIKSKGELLSLTASEACALQGEPPQPLLGAGIARSIPQLLEAKYGKDGYTIRSLQVTWSEKAAVGLNLAAPILLGFGVLALFIEFKTPGFGVFGIAGILLLGIVFLGSYISGLSGHEPVLFFSLGLLLVLVEILFFPGVAVVALIGLLLMFGSLIWAMADLWPNEPLTLSSDVFVRPLTNLGLGLVISVGLGLALARFLPKGWIWDRMVINATVGSAAQDAGSAPQGASAITSLIGAEGVAVSGLRPSGQVEIDGRRYEARVEVSDVKPGERVRVTGRSDFGLVVERIVT
jgi:membrane-bound serine protease (ClpP class)